MAEHLVITAERAPLLLDEVTAQADGARKRELLDVLHRLSQDRQVILFTHDDEVLAWADASLRGPQDALVRLEPLATQAVAIASAPAGAEPPDGAEPMIAVTID
jgi:ABC-type lipoprotein export system ATPase subunit